MLSFNSEGQMIVQIPQEQNFRFKPLDLIFNSDKLEKNVNDIKKKKTLIF